MEQEDGCTAYTPAEVMEMLFQSEDGDLYLTCPGMRPILVRELRDRLGIHFPVRHMSMRSIRAYRALLVKCEHCRLYKGQYTNEEKLKEVLRDT